MAKKRTTKTKKGRKTIITTWGSKKQALMSKSSLKGLYHPTMGWKLKIERLKNSKMYRVVGYKEKKKK